METSAYSSLISIDSIRQAPPFRYVDEVIFFDPHQRCARLVLDANQQQCRYGDASALHSYLLIESMAQASGVLLSALTVGEGGGYLVGLENAQLRVHFSDDAFAHPFFIDVAMTRANPPIFDFFVQINSGGDGIAQSMIQIMSKRTLKANFI